jgi:di/tricarboxylate transporter
MVAEVKLGAVLRILACAFAATFLLLLVGAVQDIPSDVLMREPQTVAHQPWYVGFYSGFGALVWCAAASIAAFCGALQLRHPRGDRAVGRFFLLGAVITAALLADDFFLLHDQVFYGLGISAKIVFGTYGLAILAQAVLHREVMRKTPWPVLVLGLALFALSNVLDSGRFNHLGEQWGKAQLLEDGAKLFGIVAWCVYYVTTAEWAVGGLVARAAAVDAPE